MELVSRRINHVWTEIPVYTRAEAEELGLDAVPWRDAQPGQWGITDDDYVMECKFRKKYKNLKGGEHTYVRFSCARSWIPRSSPVLFEQIRANKGYDRSTGEHWKDAAIKRGAVKSLIHQAAIQRVTRGNYDYEQLGKVYDHCGKLHHTLPLLRRLLSYPKVKQLIRKEIEKLLVDGGMTIADWIKLGERAFEKADAEDNVAEMRRIWEKWGDLLAVKERMHSKEVSPGIGGPVLDAISEDIKQLPGEGVTNGK